MYKIFLAAAATLFSALAAFSQSDTPRWLRDTRISPDGTRIAFTYKGDIFTVPASGGMARQLTSDKAYDSKPVWSPDGSRIAFRSNREGSDDIYLVNATGGTPRRLTANSSSETPLTWLNDSTLLFTAPGVPARLSVQAPMGFPIPYTINVNTPGLPRPQQYLSVPMVSADAAPDSRILFTDKKGYENYFRKHERSSATYDVWSYNPADGSFSQLTDFNGHDMEPVWNGSQDSFYFISEKDGTLNVWQRSLKGGDDRKLTDFTRHPVRSLSASRAGNKLAFSWDGDIYTLTPGAKPVKVDVEITADNYDTDRVKYYTSWGVSNMAVSPKGDEVAFVIRGDIYVTSTKYKTTRRITDTPWQERNVEFSPDGKTLVYDSDRNGFWQLFTAKMANPDTDKQFCYATEIVEEPLYKCSTAAQQPSFSPDGKKVAFLENRTEIRVIDLKTKEVTTALPARFNYSYTDGDVPFEWSPDSQWILATYIGDGGWNNTDIAIAKADGSEIVDLTESGFSDIAPKWALDGKAVTYITSKYGMKSQGSWGNTYDIILMGLEGGAWDRFNMTEEEAELDENAKKQAEDSDKDKKKDSGKKSKKKDKKSKGKKSEDADNDTVKPAKFELGDRRYRTRRLTAQAGNLLDYWLNPKGTKLYYMTSEATGKYSLLSRDLRKGDVSVVASGLAGGMMADKDGENLFVLTDNGIRKVEIGKGGEVKNVDFEAQYDRKPSAEREYIYDHMLRQVNDKFYDVKLHNVDWEYYGDHYRQFLPHINNNRDFADLLSEILGELNASHTGGRASSGYAQLPTSSLGAFFDPDFDGNGLRITEILPRGPLSPAKAGIRPGDVILAIDGTTIEAGKDYSPLLEGKAGRKTRLSIRHADGTTAVVPVKPISQGTERNLLYQRWVERNEHTVDSVSNGRIGYVHVSGMDSPSYREVYERALGKYRNCDALIVDTRYNGGGWLHNDLAIFLSGKEYVRFSPRGQYIGSEPFSQWTKPSVMLVGEANYSDAHGAPYVYQTLGIGDIVGAPVPGTMTAVWWETQIDPDIVFGIPQVTSLDMNGQPLENKQLNPEVTVRNAPAEVERGIDAQLIRATRHLMDKTRNSSK